MFFNAGITVRVPMRIGFAGGGTDISEFSERYDGAVINCTIAKYVYINIEAISGESLSLLSCDLGLEEIVPKNFIFSPTDKLALIKAVYVYFCDQYKSGHRVPLRVTTYSDVPAGSGLGASSSLTVGLVAGFSRFFQAALDPIRVAEIAYFIERQVCGIKGGKQDQYAAAIGGFNLLTFHNGGEVKIRPLNVERQTVCALESTLLMGFAGKSRHSSEIINDQVAVISAAVKDKIFIDMVGVAHSLAIALLESNLNLTFGLINEGWLLKSATSSSIIPPRYEEIINRVMSAGAKFCRISGAGGGGYILAGSSLQDKGVVSKVFSQFHIAVENVKFVHHGYEIL